MSNEKGGTPPTSNLGDDTEQGPLGYVLLENCTLPKSSWKKHWNGVPSKEWVDVRVLASPFARDSRRQPSEEPPECPHCNIAFHPKATEVADEEEEIIRLDTIPLFDGTVRTLKCEKCEQASRSDLSLLFGLLRAASSAARIRGIKAFLRELEDHQPTVACLVLLDFPHLSRNSGQTRRSILPQASTKGSQKELDPSLQLLLSIISSDWTALDASIVRIQETKSQERSHSQSLSFFPPQLSLKELYARVNATTTTASNLVHSTPAFHHTMHQKNSFLANLPLEALEKVASFLRAPSLENLRLSCKYLHYELRGMVPGLKLRLYQHQVNSLCWMRQREKTKWEEKDTLAGKLDHEVGDAHRCATGGQTALLRNRSGTQFHRVDQMFGFETSSVFLETVPRSVACGGLLCDDPGLGKTITVLSLILQTIGLSGVKLNSEYTNKEKPPENGDEKIFEMYWRDHFPPGPFRRETLLRLINSIGRLDTHASFSVNPIKLKIEKDAYLDFADLENDIQIHLVDKIDGTLSHGFKTRCFDLVREFKRKQIGSAKKSFSSTAAKPNSRVAALLESQEQGRLSDALKKSCGTLLVVPENLIEHWHSQIKEHVDLKFLTGKTPFIYEFNKGERNGMMELENKPTDEWEQKYCPILFIDKGGTHKLPSSSFLSRFVIVITTTQRLSYEYQNGSFQSELAQGQNGTPKYIADIRDASVTTSINACSLFKVQWTRIIVDEGHSMAKDRTSSTIISASWIQARVRWAMTGTPTKQSTKLGELRGLMRYLQHDFFGSRLSGEHVWKTNILRAWNRGSISSFFRLQGLLSLLMKRHTKLDIRELPPPSFSVKVINMSETETASYNTLVASIMSNLLLTAMEGKTSGKQDSLLHVSQSANARKALANVRRTCVGFANVIPTLSHKSYLETIELLNNLSLSHETITKIKVFLHSAESGVASPCECCRLWLSFLLVLPCCGALLCPECLDADDPSCPCCDKSFDVDVFQRLQPGFVLEWLDNLKVTAETKSNQKTVSLPVNRGVLESDLVQPDNVIAIRPAQARHRSNRPGDGHQCKYDSYSVDGACTLCLEPHALCYFINKAKRCETCFKIYQPCSPDESKPYYLCQSIGNLIQSHLQRGRLASSLRMPPLKIIIFSQFRSALNFVGDRLIKEFGGNCVAEYWGRHKSLELQRFVLSSECFMMLLSKDGSEGLDLSFVSHMYFLEAIYDKSLGDQAIARAWRMGAKNSVLVETLIAENTIEETMQHSETQFSSDRNKQVEHSRSQFLLKSLKLMTDHHRVFGEFTVPEKASMLSMESTHRHSKTEQSERPSKRVRFE